MITDEIRARGGDNDLQYVHTICSFNDETDQDPKKHNNSFALDSCILLQDQTAEIHERKVYFQYPVRVQSIRGYGRPLCRTARPSIHPLTSAGSSQADREKVYKACFRQFSVLTRRWQ